MSYSYTRFKAFCYAFFAILSCFSGPIGAFAQETASGPVAVPSVSVDAIASSRADLAPDSTSNLARVAPSSRPQTETFTRAEIEDLKPENIYDLLSHATGVVATYQGRKLSNNLQIRGDSNYGIIIDGAYIPLSVSGRILQTLPVSVIEQVDIIRDPTALTLGPLADFDSPSGALNSGFIVIRTHVPDKTEGEARTSVESYGTVAGSGYAGTTFNGGLSQPSGYVSGFTGYKKSDGPSGYNAWSNSESALLKAGLTAGALQADVSIFQDISRYGFERATAGQNTAALVAQNWSYSPIQSVQIASNFLFTWNPVQSTLFNFSYDNVSANNIQASYTSNAVTSNFDREYIVNANLRHNIRFDNTLIQLGGEYVSNSSPTGQLFYSGYANSQETSSGYANLEQKLVNNSVSIDVSGRVDSHKIIQGIDLYNQGNGSGTTTGGTGSAGGKTGGGSTSSTYKYFYNRQLPLAANYAAGAAWTIVPQLLATARYSHTEQGAVSNILSANGSELSPESQNKWEIGLQAPIATYLNAGFNFFDTAITNDKTATGYVTINGYQTPVWTESDTKRTGFELLAHGDLLESDWLGQTSYRVSWMHLTDVSSSSITNYSQTIAHDVTNLSITQAWQGFNGTLALTYVSPYLSNFNSADGFYHGVGNFVVVDLRLGHDFKIGQNDLKVSVYGRNITDRKYETVYGYPAWGSVYGGELVVSF